MSAGEHRSVSEPGELVQPPRSSWLPPFLAFAIAVMVCGIYAEGFMVRGWIYSLIAGVAALLIFRAVVADGVRDYYRLRRRQRVRGAVLPVETISPPKRRDVSAEDAADPPRATPLSPPSPPTGR